MDGRLLKVGTPATFSRGVFYNVANLSGQFICCSFTACVSTALVPPLEKQINRPAARKKKKKNASPRWFDFHVGVATATSTTKRHRESKFLSLSFIWMCLRSLQGISIGKERCTTVGKGRGGAPGSSGEHLASLNATNYYFSQKKAAC